MLLKKANESLVKYGVHNVVANLLQTRKDEIKLVTLSDVLTIHRGSDAEIEKRLIEELVARHAAFQSGEK